MLKMDVAVVCPTCGAWVEAACDGLLLGSEVLIDKRQSDALELGMAGHGMVYVIGSAPYKRLGSVRMWTVCGPEDAAAAADMRGVRLARRGESGPERVGAAQAPGAPAPCTARRDVLLMGAEWCSQAAASLMLGVTRQHVRTLVRSGVLQCVTVGGRPWIGVASLEARRRARP